VSFEWTEKVGIDTLYLIERLQWRYRAITLDDIMDQGTVSIPDPDDIDGGEVVLDFFQQGMIALRFTSPLIMPFDQQCFAIIPVSADLIQYDDGWMWESWFEEANRAMARTILDRMDREMA
jgi:hypothetical protein